MSSYISFPSISVSPPSSPPAFGAPQFPEEEISISPSASPERAPKPLELVEGAEELYRKNLLIQLESKDYEGFASSAFLYIESSKGRNLHNDVVKWVQQSQVLSETEKLNFYLELEKQDLGFFKKMRNKDFLSTPYSTQNDEDLSVLKERAEKKDPQALYELGVYYLYTPGADHERKAADLLEMAAQHDYIEATFLRVRIVHYIGIKTETLGQMFSNLLSNGRSKLTDQQLYSIAYFYDWHCRYDPERSECFELYIQLAEKGSLKAMSRLYDICMHSISFAQPARPKDWDSKKHFELFKSFAEKGHVKSMLETACAYRFGNEVEKDLPSALEWYVKAADKKDSHATFFLGELYKEGKEIPADLSLACEYFKLSLLSIILEASKAHDKEGSSISKHLCESYVRCARSYVSTCQRRDGEEDEDEKWEAEVIEQVKSSPLLSKEAKEDFLNILAHEFPWHFKHSPMPLPEESWATAPLSPDLGKEFTALLGAKRFHPEAYYRLALCYEHGWGVDQCAILAKMYFKKAMQGGHQEAARRIIKELDDMHYDAKMLRQIEAAFPDWDLLSSQELYQLGQVCNKLTYSLIHNKGKEALYSKKAFEFFEKSADKGNEGDLQAIYNVYKNRSNNAFYIPIMSKLAEKEVRGAIEALFQAWRFKSKDPSFLDQMRKLAALGHKGAMKEIAFAYHIGKNAPQSYKLAADWYKKAEDHDSLTRLYEGATGDLCAKALEYFMERKNATGYAKAAFNYLEWKKEGLRYASADSFYFSSYQMLYGAKPTTNHLIKTALTEKAQKLLKRVENSPNLTSEEKEIFVQELQKSCPEYFSTWGCTIS